MTNNTTFRQQQQNVSPIRYYTTPNHSSDSPLNMNSNPIANNKSSNLMSTDSFPLNTSITDNPSTTNTNTPSSSSGNSNSNTMKVEQPSLPINHIQYSNHHQNNTNGEKDNVHQLRLLENDQGFLTYIDPMTSTHYAFIKQEQAHPVFLPALSTILYGAPNNITKKTVDSYYL